MASLIIPIIVVIVVIAGAVFYFYPEILSQPAAPATPTGYVDGLRFTGSDVAAATALWAEGIRSEGGEIYNSYYCDGPGGPCGGRDGISLKNNVMLYLLYSKLAESDPGYSDDADREFESLSKMCADSGGAECESHYILAMGEIGAGDEEISEAGDRFLESNYTEDAQDTIRILSVIHKAHPDPNTLGLASYFLDVFRNATSSGDSLFRYPGGAGLFDCAVRNSEMDVYSMSGDEALLESVKSFFDQNDVVESTGEMRNALEVIQCAEAAGKLADATGDASYRQASLEMVRVLVGSFWDADGRPLSYSGGGFSSNAVLPHVQVTEETLRAGVLAAGFASETLLEVGSN